jgi:hypothetical protein
MILLLYIGKIGRTNEKQKHKNAPYFKASSRCNEKGCSSEYSLWISKKPVTIGKGFVEVSVRRSKDHTHRRLGKIFNLL